MRRHDEAIESLGTHVLGLAARRLTEERRRGGEWGRRLGLAAGGLVARERVQLEHRRTRASRGARALIAAAGHRVEELVGWISPRVRRFLAQAGERTVQRGRRLDLVDPRRVLERGYSILRTAEGTVLQDAGLAPAGTLVRARLKRGSLQLRSEGPMCEQGGD